MNRNLREYFKTGENIRGNVVNTTRKANNLKRTTRSATKSIVGNKRGRNNTVNPRSRPVNRTVKYFKRENVPTVSKLNSDSFFTFLREMRDMPVYFINAHACICSHKPTCFDEPFTEYFTIPKNVYLLSFVEAGDYSCVDEGLANWLSYDKRQKTGVADYFLLHSPSDMELNDSIGKSRFSIFSYAKRAAQRRDGGEPIKYPNIIYSFNPDTPDTPPEKNVYGVYRIDLRKMLKSEFTNNNSIISQDSSKQSYFLEDIIYEVFEKTGMNKGIFINGGCMSSCSSKNFMGKHIDDAAKMIEYANNMYTTIRDVVTKEEAKSLYVRIPRNTGYPVMFTYEEPKLTQYMMKEGLYDPAGIKVLEELTHRNDRENLKRFVAEAEKQSQ